MRGPPMMRQNPRLERASLAIRRRLFLKALGIGLSAPMAHYLARSALAAPSAAPKRFFLFFMPHGVPPEHFNPRVQGGDLKNFALDQTNVSILGPLEPYKQYVNVYQGFQYPGDFSAHEGIVNVLSGSDISDTTSPRTSVETVIAKALGVQPVILGACAHQPYGLDRNAMLFWNGTPIDPQKDPSAVADKLFGGAAAAAPASTGSASANNAVSNDVQFRNELMTLTAQELEDLQKQVTGLTQEQSKLQAHLQAVQGLQSQGSGSQQGSVSAVGAAPGTPVLPTVEQVRAASAGQVIDSSGGNDYFYQEKNFPLIYQAQLELTAQALIYNAAQIVGLQPMYTTCDFDFSFAKAPGSHHNGLSHTTAQAAASAQWNSPISVDNYNPQTRVAFATAQRWFYEQLVTHVVSLLAQTDDPFAPGTTVLDNTLIYCMSEIGDGANHLRVSGLEYPQVPSELPLVTIGNAGGSLLSGQVVVASQPVAVDNGSKGPAGQACRRASDLYLTLAQALGANGVSFPDTSGVLREVLA